MLRVGRPNRGWRSPCMSVWRFAIRRLATTSAVLGLVSVQLACGGSGTTTTGTSSQAPAPQFTLGVIANADEFTPQLLAASAGLFAKNGVDVTVTDVAPPALHSALASGSVDGLAITADPAVLRIVQHLPYVVVGQAMQAETFALLAGPGIHSLQDLAGKTIAAPALGQIPTAVLTNMLQKADLQSRVHVDYVSLTATAGTLFRSGQVDAIFEPGNILIQAQAGRPGSTVIVTAAAASPEFPPSGLTVTQDYLAAHRDTVLRVMKALLEADQLALRSPSVVEKLWQTTYGLTADQASALYILDKPTFATDAVPSDAAFAYLASVETATASPAHTFSAADIMGAWDLALARQATQQVK